MRLAVIAVCCSLLLPGCHQSISWVDPSIKHGLQRLDSQLLAALNEGLYLPCLGPAPSTKQLEYFDYGERIGSKPSNSF
jgi:hypothetical protein